MTEQVAPLLEFDRADLCVHRWKESAQIDLQNPGRMLLPRIYRCERCDLQRRGDSREMPKIGRGK